MHKRDHDRSKKEQADLTVQYFAKLLFTQPQLGDSLELLFVLIQIAVQPEIEKAAGGDKKYDPDKEPDEHQRPKAFINLGGLILQRIEVIVLVIGKLVRQFSAHRLRPLLSGRPVPSIIAAHFERLCKPSNQLIGDDVITTHRPYRRGNDRLLRLDDYTWLQLHRLVEHLFPLARQPEIYSNSFPCGKLDGLNPHQLCKVIIFRLLHQN
ncbi:hypothetical protein D3C75_706460 [compost metagenome]